MCTFNLSVEDDLLTRVNTAFANREALSAWLQSQVNKLLVQYANDLEVEKDIRHQQILELAGSWSEDPRTTEQIMDQIHGARTTNTMPSL